MAYNPNYLGKLASDPGSPIEGQLYYNTTVKAYRYYNGTAWEGVGGIILPDGSNLLGTYTGSTLVAGNATLTADTVIQGDLFVEGSLTNTGGYALTVKGDCFVGQFFFSPTNPAGIQKAVTVTGDLKLGALVTAVGPDTITADQDDGGNGYFHTTTDLTALGYTAGTDDILVTFLTGNNAGLVIFGVWSPGQSRINLDGEYNNVLPGDQAIITQRSYSLQPHFRANAGQPVKFTIGGTFIVGEGTQFDCTGQGNAGVAANGLYISVGGNLIGATVSLPLTGNPIITACYITNNGTLAGGTGAIGGNGGVVDVGGNCNNVNITCFGADAIGGNGGNGGRINVAGNLTMSNSFILHGGNGDNATGTGGIGGMITVLGNIVGSGNNIDIYGGNGGVLGGTGGNIYFQYGNVTGSLQINNRGGSSANGAGGNGGGIAEARGSWTDISIDTRGGDGATNGGGGNGLTLDGMASNVTVTALGGNGTSGNGGRGGDCTFNGGFQGGSVFSWGGNGGVNGGDGGGLFFEGDTTATNFWTYGGNGGSGNGGNGNGITAHGNLSLWGTWDNYGGSGTTPGSIGSLNLTGNYRITNQVGNPDYYTIKGTVRGNVTSPKEIILGGDLSVSGDCITNGDFSTTIGPTVTIGGDLIVQGGMHFSPDPSIITQGSIQINGDFLLSLNSDFRINPGVGYVQIGVGGDFIGQQLIVTFDGSGNNTGGSGSQAGTGLFVAILGNVGALEFNLNGGDATASFDAGDGGTLWCAGGDCLAIGLLANGGNSAVGGKNAGQGGFLQMYAGDLVSQSAVSVQGGNNSVGAVGGDGGTLMIKGIMSPNSTYSVVGGTGTPNGSDGTIATRVILDQNSNLYNNTDGTGDLGSPDAGATLKRPNKAFIKSELHINGNDMSACLEASSTTQGFLEPRMTTTQRNAIASPTEGLQIYNTTDHELQFYNGSTWEAVAALPDDLPVSYPVAQTTGTGFTTVATILLPTDNTTYLVTAKIVGRKTDGTKHAVFELAANFDREGAGASQNGATVSLVSLNTDDATYAAQFLASGNNILVQSHGNTIVGEIVNWKVVSEIVQVS